jgi:methionine synthase II (cobalamin-independent)
VEHVVQYGGYIIDHMKKYYKQRRLTHQIKNIERRHLIGISDVQKAINQYKDEIQKLIKPIENDISILYGMCYKYLSKYIEYINSIDISYSPDENQFRYNSRNVTKNYYTIKFYIEFMVSFIEQLVDRFISTLIAKPSIQKYEEKLIIEDELNFQKLYLSYLHETDMFAVNKSTSKSKASPQINNSNKSSNEIPRGYNIIKTDKGYKLGNTFGGKPRRRSKTSKAL